MIKNTSKGTACVPDQHMIVQNLDKIISRVSKIISYLLGRGKSGTGTGTGTGISRVKAGRGPGQGPEFLG